MPEFRFSGKYKFAPDRGSPEGDTEAFSEEFEAADDKAARTWVAAFRSTHVDIEGPRLVRIVKREQTTPVSLK